jgi:cytochrome d ubiquinol oxidase subunit II
MDLAIIWSILIGVALFVYMALDGFDLGVGILYPFGSSSQQRDHMMNSIAPVWDTNETWLILAAGGLYGIFPKAYVFIFNALYIPLIAMLIFLIFRGLSFEFRFKSQERFKFIWSTTFFIGSLGMAVCQGIILGQLISGFHAVDGQFDNNYWSWLNSFNLCVGGLVSLFYAFIGANFLIYRLEGEEQHHFKILSKYLLWGNAAYFIVLSILAGYTIKHAAPTFPAATHLNEQFQAFYPLYIGLMAILALIVIKLHYLLTDKKTADGLPFIYSIALLACAFTGIAFLGWPYIVPGVYTIWEASSHPETQKLMFIGAVITLPLILGYSFYNFYVFRGKIANQKFYH